MKLIHILLLVFLLLPVESTGQEPTFLVWGGGCVSCAKFIELAEGHEGNQYQFDQWLYGYITGRNRENANIVDYSGGIESIALMTWIKNYCKDHPLDSFEKATNELLLELKRT